MTFSTPPSGFIAPAHGSYGSCSSWGTAPSSGQAPTPPAAWTSERSKSPVGIHMGSMLSPSTTSPSFSYPSPSWGSQLSTLQGSWGNASPASAQSTSRFSSTYSLVTASTTTLVNRPMMVQAVHRSDGYPANLTGIAPTPVHIHVDLENARRLRIDMAEHRPCFNPNSSLGDSAFCPSMTYMDVEFDGCPETMVLSIHAPPGLSVFTVVEQIWNYLRGKHTSHCIQSLPNAREHGASPSSFHRGALNLDVLRQARGTKLVEFRPSARGGNRWTACFAQ